LIVLLASLAFALGAAEVTVLSLSGSVEIKEPGRGWAPASVGQTVASSSMISTGFGSRARLSAGGMDLNLQPLTRVTIDSLVSDGDTDRTAVSLQSGRVRATRPPVTRANRSTRRNIDFRVSTPVATAAVRGTDFYTSHNKLETVEGLVSYSQGQAVVMTPGGTYSWAVPGLRPINPTDVASGIWGVSPDAGTFGDDRYRRRSPSSRVGSVRIELQ
jgi:hypothetical protein